MRIAESSIECACNEKIKNEKRKWTIESIGEELKELIEERNKHRMCLIKEGELFLNDEWKREIEKREVMIERLKEKVREVREWKVPDYIEGSRIVERTKKEFEKIVKRVEKSVSERRERLETFGNYWMKIRAELQELEELMKLDLRREIEEYENCFEKMDVVEDRIGDLEKELNRLKRRDADCKEKEKEKEEVTKCIGCD